ncbi:tetratricopeptide repeat protein [uncultured Roseovarius sp.]|uniref:tetratricopeptide repeat protein n=1 Tax=uncultured Roseovarius sp. TaxID=293344 RepID=UPI002635459A|nr:tetratricopeptide repeat protein [uncultured Roseovarius sp.]
MFRITLAIALVLPALAFAAGGGGSSAPKPSETTKKCKSGKIWDKGSRSCVHASNSILDDDTLYGAVREFAYAGQLGHAQTVLAAMSDQNDDRVLTYWGFTHRKLGNVDKGMAFYRKAIAQNPGNALARSYMGQALVEQGDLIGARQQLLAIRSSGGEGSWAEASLYQAIATGATYSY